MPSPVAKGIIITVAALVAAGIAVYESPQFQEWVNNSRRKIALALHNLGDEIQPRDSTSSPREDISMMEEVGPAAEERRRIAREEIQKRAAALEERRKRCQGGLIGSFDALVDENGNLLRPDSREPTDSTLANSTAVDLPSSQLVHRGPKEPDVSASVSEIRPAGTMADSDTLHLEIPSTGNHSASLVDLTPTSDDTDMDFFASTGDKTEEAERPVHSSATDQERMSTSSHTEEGSQTIYEHPESSLIDSNRELRSPFSDLSELNTTGFEQQERSSTPSTADSFSHVYESAEDATSDGTLSDLGRSMDGVATPASWSEVGSVVSNEDLGHHGF
ncbi:uncharacterized protein NFIA_012890 [Aspergillus fischeri NRRL 181]|uniref:Uncharacterized protein n=1 Tax=Neosartorya fischeri (strain ATCC 1020 / DSM 3700 / CBS 544.65 / FGSC A1164 / JCM 1740 / NRRL 181 / WB 181) TaxID=331117 RepID=A1D2F7_NEOFI|nr:conserved hypothetical protein [Aspergillus fischeri NRRL 181]EAW22600.1 conserved hypothetical protein [Aspergillus fischeri NRRL 181]